MYEESKSKEDEGKYENMSAIVLASLIKRVRKHIKINMYYSKYKRIIKYQVGNVSPVLSRKEENKLYYATYLMKCEASI
jgi:hypothetical protein